MAGPIIIKGKDAVLLRKVMKAEYMLHLSVNDKDEVEIDWEEF